MPNNYICALDIGSSKIAAGVALIKKRCVENMFFESMPAKGIRRGTIVDSIDLINSIDKVLNNLRSESGINIKFVYANVGGQDILTKHSLAIMPLAERGNKVITLSDIHKVNEQARILGSSLEEEIVHQIPFSYAIDSKANILNPLGLYSHRLEVDLYLICVRLSSMQSLTRSINHAGFEIKDLFLSSLAASRAVFNDKITFDKGINILCDIGSDITEIAIFQNGAFIALEVLPVGGDDLTMRLSEELKISFELAEDVKRSHGLVGEYNQINEDKEILVKRHNVYKTIRQKLVAELLTLNSKPICQMVKEAVEKNVSLVQVNSFVAIGRSLLLEGLLEMLENTLGVPVKLGRISHPDLIPFMNKNNALSSHNYLTYITSCGMICQALHNEETYNTSSIQQPTNGNLVLKTLNKVKDIYQEYF